MNRDKQIEEMCNDLSEGDIEFIKYCRDRRCQECEYYFAKTDCEIRILAEKLVAKGYRKASDLAAEIFEEIEKEIEIAIDSNYRAKKEHYGLPNYDNFKAKCDGKIFAMRDLLDFIAELKKKYTEMESGNG